MGLARHCLPLVLCCDLLPSEEAIRSHTPAWEGSVLSTMRVVECHYYSHQTRSLLVLPTLWFGEGRLCYASRSTSSNARCCKSLNQKTALTIAASNLTSLFSKARVQTQSLELKRKLLNICNLNRHHQFSLVYLFTWLSLYINKRA